MTADLFSDCLLLADDFTQYYLGAFTRAPRSDPESLVGTGAPIAGPTTPLAGTATNPIDEAGTFLPTSAVLPPDEFPQFASARVGRLPGRPAGQPRDLRGRLVRRGDARRQLLHAARADRRPHRGHRGARHRRWSSRCPTTSRPGYDNVIVEAHPVGTDDWTTLPEAGGLSDTDSPAECEVGFLLELHPFLGTT